MKKLMAIVISIILVCSNVVFAEESWMITEKISEIWLSPEKDVQVLDNIKKANEAKIEELIKLYLIAPGYAREQIGISADDEEMKKQVKEKYSVKENDILKVYYMINNSYAKQYTDNQSFKYIISDDYYWFMKTGEYYQEYEMDGKWYDYSKDHNTTIGLYVIDDEAFNFLKNQEKICDVLKEINVSTIQSIKFVALNGMCTCLYIECEEEEYLVRIYLGTESKRNNDGIYQSYNWVENLELYKLYTAKEFMKIISDEANVMNSTKPTFETEALNLQENGLLLGNENGLDLLKPLTRIEAATMLLRALGESTANEATVQTFADVPTTHWGYGAAENAYSLGLIKGIGDDKFAPDDMVTGTQFATMVLRAGNHAEFNWEEALNILITEGVISSEDASTMDFFTRGDMAKIIYESIEKGMF